MCSGRQSTLSDRLTCPLPAACDAQIGSTALSGRNAARACASAELHLLPVLFLATAGGVAFEVAFEQYLLHDVCADLSLAGLRTRGIVPVILSLSAPQSAAAASFLFPPRARGKSVRGFSHELSFLAFHWLLECRTCLHYTLEIFQTNV